MSKWVTQQAPERILHWVTIEEVSTGMREVAPMFWQNYKGWTFDHNGDVPLNVDFWRAVAWQKAIQPKPYEGE